MYVYIYNYIYTRNPGCYAPGFLALRWRSGMFSRILVCLRSVKYISAHQIHMVDLTKPNGNTFS